jgi:hypothetical protein
MARARMFRPEHRQHRKVGPLSDAEYRLWCSMILEADDAGRLVCDAAQLRVQTWGYHPTVKVKSVEAAIEKLADSGLIQTYEIEGVRYAFFPSWADYQKPRFPTPSRLPAPALPKDYGNPTVALRKDSGEGVVVVGVKNKDKVVVGEGRGRGGEPLKPDLSLSSSETTRILLDQSNGIITEAEARARLRAMGKVK